MTKTRRILLLSYRYAESGAIMVRHRSLVTYLCEKGVAVDVVGKTKLIIPLEKGVTYTQVSRFFFSYFYFLVIFIEYVKMA